MKKQDYYQERYRQSTPSWQDSISLYVSTISRLVNEDTRILDVGCGQGDLMKSVYKKTDFTYGIDPDAESLEKNRIIKNRIHGSVDNLPFPDNFFDVVVSMFVLEHLENPAVAFKEIHRVLKPNGKVVFLTPNTWNYNVWIIRLIPEIFHDFLAHKLFDRKEHDTYPKYYRVNSVKKINGILAPTGFKRVKLLLNGDPTYISFNNFLFKFSCLLEGIIDKRFKFSKVHLIGIYEK